MRLECKYSLGPDERRPIIPPIQPLTLSEDGLTTRLEIDTMDRLSFGAGNGLIHIGGWTEGKPGERDDNLIYAGIETDLGQDNLIYAGVMTDIGQDNLLYVDPRDPRKDPLIREPEPGELEDHSLYAGHQE
jgi:hypothetical protein